MLKPRCQSILPNSKRSFRKALVDWFRESGKDYPWRRTRDPYEILVSEVMLQQTQIATVLGKRYYQRFLASFPDVHALASASDEALLKAWEGLGYYRRVRMLRDTARAVIDQHGGEFPETLEALLKLPGVGRYTAGALRAFAFCQPAVLVDGNVSRVLARLMDFRGAIDDTAGVRWLWEMAAELADPQEPQSYHAGLMELGQRYCVPGVPDCLACPVARFCQTREPAELPVKGRKATVTAVDEHALWVRDRNGRLLLHQESGARRTGLWKLPLRESAAVAQLPVVWQGKYAITRYRVTLTVHDAGSSRKLAQPAEGEQWVDAESIAGLAIAAPFRKAIEQLLTDF